MSTLVPREEIELIVGVPRDQTRHYAKAVSFEHTVYILHSQECLDSGRDLRECPYSLALDEGIDVDLWVEDVPVVAAIEDGALVPAVSEGASDGD